MTRGLQTRDSTLHPPAHRTQGMPQPFPVPLCVPVLKILLLWLRVPSSCTFVPFVVKAGPAALTHISICSGWGCEHPMPDCI